MSKVEVNKLKSKRGILRASVTKVISKIEAELANPKLNADSIELLTEHLREKAEKLKIADSDLENYLSIEELEEYLNGVEEYSEKITTCQFLAKKKISKIRNDELGNLAEQGTSIDHKSETNRTQNQTIKLPKLIISKFHGDLSDWLTFWNSFKSSIHENQSLGKVDKFNYLKSFLGGTALNTIDGLALTDENYDAAIDLLKDRFGNTNALISAHMDQLLKINSLKSSSDIKNFRKIFDHIQKNLRSLQNLGVTSENYSAVLTPLLLKSFPPDLILEYNKCLTENQNSDLEHLINFLSKQLIAREKSNSTHPVYQEQFDSSKHSKFSSRPMNHELHKSSRYSAGVNRGHKQSTAAELIATEINKKETNCIFCEGAHRSIECQTARSLSFEEKRNKCKQKGICFRCLGHFHKKEKCRARINCKLCNGSSHLKVMCFKNSRISNLEDKQTEINKQTEDKPCASENNFECNLWNSVSGKIYLQTLIVKVTRNEIDYFIRAIIDTASSHSFVTKHVAKKLKLRCLGKESVIHGLFGGTERKVNHGQYSIVLREINDHFSCTLNVMDQEKICSTIPKLENPEIINELRDQGILLSDLTINENVCMFDKDPKECHILIGADYAGKLFTGGIKTLSGGLVAMNTHLGWVVLGGLSADNLTEHNEILPSLHVNSVKLSDLWSLDSLGITDPALSQTKKEIEESAVNYFRDTITRDSEGRYQVSLPWVENHPELPDNLPMARNRLKSCINKLEVKECLPEYENVFKEWLEESIIETVDDLDGIRGGCHYLPHRAVIKENSTTRIRPVFDASAKEKNAISLNECIEKGPNYLEIIPKILNRFRVGRYGVIADIRKAFLQIGIHPQDRDFLRFLWWEKGNPSKLKVYRHRRVVFGVNASPFLLAATINFHLENVREHHRDTALKLKESMYVDNCVASVNSVEELNSFISYSKEVMADAKFDLRGWKHSNLERDKNPEPNMSSNESDETISVLGLKWNLQRDTLSCDVKEEPKLSPTKRNVLSAMHKLFDPLGFTSPVTLMPKQILQECWKQKVTWDEVLPPDLAKKFIRWLTQLHYLKEIEIPRKIPNLDEDVTLHVFCDASSIAYATCIFLRRSHGKSVECQLLQSRSKIAPVRPITIPRLEILSCTIGARLAKTVKEDLNLGDIRTYYWCDSMNALYWIKREENWATFILNRVNEIRKISDPDNWYHIPGKFNPADFPSRGCYPKELEKSKWWLGPKWIYQPPEEWPSTSEETSDPNVVNAERRKTVISATNAMPPRSEDIFVRIANYDSVLKVICWMYRFTRNALLEPALRTQGAITSEEIKHAEMIACRLIQKQSFSGITDKTIRDFQPISDSNGVIRVKSRIIERKDEEDFRLPTLLPSDHPLVWKLIKTEHEKMGHAGTQFLMCRLRERYWIVRSRKTIRRVVRNCVQCRKFDASPIETPPSVLPEDRVRDAKIFEVVGIDLTGPLFLKGKQKVWIVLYTCAIFRAIHLELVSSLSTESFLQALRRFISRRGRPAVIYSDNGTNFVGADNLFRKIDWNAISKAAAVQRISWKFIPPSSPWWGGWWERLIGVMKRILRKVLGRSSLNYESLLTVLCDCENTMNNRPLTYLSEDVSDLAALTPAMFLHELPVTGVPDIDHIDANSIKRGLLHQQKLLNDLRKRFRSEYLGQLKQNSKFIKNPASIKIGDLMLISSQHKRVNWPLARVTEILPSKDGQVRVVKVRTSNGELLKTVKTLIPLEVNSPSDPSDYLRRLRSSTGTGPQGGSVTFEAPLNSAFAATPDTSAQEQHKTHEPGSRHWKELKNGHAMDALQ